MISSLKYKSIRYLLKRNILFNIKNFKTLKTDEVKILGLETSCDDTGCSIINSKGEILSESLHSQHLVHLRNGGIIPDVAQDLHRTYIETVVSKTLNNINLNIDNITAIAVTVKPGLALSLVVGLKYAKYLARKFKKPLIPIHHMQAHALVARLKYTIPFPFLVLLISGGHCLLGVVNDVDKFILLGQSLDAAPGEVLDRVARRLKLRNIPEYSQICGGQAIEFAAAKSENPNSFSLPFPLAEQKDCNFSFNGIKTGTIYKLVEKEKYHETKAHSLIPEVNDLCASLLMATTRHLVHRVQRAMEYCKTNNLIPEDKQQLVVSGGVACNNFIFKGLSMLCEEHNYEIYRPPRDLCTDNGTMIAWNGLEKWKAGIDTEVDLDGLDIEARAPLGLDHTELVAKANIRTKVMKLKMFNSCFFFNSYPTYTYLENCKIIVADLI